MSSELIVDELTGRASAGSIAVTAEGGTVTTSLQQGLAKAWVNFTGITTTAIRDSLNISGLTDAATGQTNLAYSNAMASVNYMGSFYTNASASGGISDFGNQYTGVYGNGSDGRQTGLTKVGSYSSGFIDSLHNDVATFGDLA
jgi:hypothetical protein